MINKNSIMLYMILSIVAVLLGSLIFWGLGNLIIMVFNINYKWTFIHGFVIELIWIMLKQLLGGKR